MLFKTQYLFLNLIKSLRLQALPLIHYPNSLLLVINFSFQLIIMEPISLWCPACTTFSSDLSSFCDNCGSRLVEHRPAGSNPSSLHNLDTNLILLSERLASLVQALQDLTNRMNTGGQKKDPATEEMIDRIPQLEIWDTECPICLEVQTADLRQMPCGHVYHSDCLIPWLRHQRTCPQCRRELVE